MAHAQQPIAGDALLARIAAVEPAEAEIMRQNVTRFTLRPCSFYLKHRIIQATVERWDAVYELRYADDGQRIFPFDGEPQRVYQINRQERLQLQESQVADYVRFFFESVGNGLLCIAESAEEVVWLNEDEETLQDAKEQSRPLIHRVRIESEKDSRYVVNATAIWHQLLVEVTLQVDRQGEVKPLNQRLLLEDLPVVIWNACGRPT
jgi:hypothetical protein